MGRLIRNKDFILMMALAAGLVWGKGAVWTEELMLPALAVVMTISTMGISTAVFSSRRLLITSTLSAIVLNYFLLGGFLIALSSIFIDNDALRSGFILISAVPPAVAVIPFTLFLKGDASISLVGTIGAYLAALFLTPLITVLFFGAGFFAPGKLLLIMVELILVPLILAQILVRTGLAPRIEPFRGAITNWSFFLITYTIVGLNRDIFISEPLSLLPVALIALASTFFLGWVIGRLGSLFKVQSEALISYVLLGTMKNYGLAGGLALTLFSRETAVPATVSTIFMIVYIIWLGFQSRWRK